MLPTKVILFGFVSTYKGTGNKSAQVRAHTVQQRPKTSPTRRTAPPLCLSGVSPPRAPLKAASFTAHA